MDWFEVTTYKDNIKTLINAESILKLSYSKDTDLTVIEYQRGAYPATYLKGNYMPDIKRLLSSHDHYVSKIGE